MSLGAFLSDHDFVAFGIKAKSEVDHAVFFFGFADESAAVFLNEFDGGGEVVALKAQAGPGTFTFASAVDANGGTAEGEFAPDFHFEGELGTEGVLIEFDGAEMVRSPEGVFDFLNLHGGGVAPDWRAGKRGL